MTNGHEQCRNNSCKLTKITYIVSAKTCSFFAYTNRAYAYEYKQLQGPSTAGHNGHDIVQRTFFNNYASYVTLLWIFNVCFSLDHVSSVFPLMIGA